MMCRFFTRSFTHLRSGKAWLFGAFAVLSIMTLMLIAVEKYKLDVVLEDMEDVLTSSALGSLVYDEAQYTLSHEIHVEPWAVKERLISLVGLNTDTGINLYGLDTPDMRYGMAYGYDADNMDGTGYLTQIWVCNVHNDGTNEVVTFELDSNYVTCMRFPNGVLTTPEGEVITQTGVYIEFKFPYKICGKRVWLKKASYVNAVVY